MARLAWFRSRDCADTDRSLRGANAGHQFTCKAPGSFRMGHRRAVLQRSVSGGPLVHDADADALVGMGRCHCRSCHRGRRVAATMDGCSDVVGPLQQPGIHDNSGRR